MASVRQATNRVLYVVALNHATNDGSVYLLSSLFPIVLSIFNISVLQVGVIVAIGYLVNVLFQPVVGRYSEGRDPGKLLAIGIFIISVSIASFVFATGFSSLLTSVVLLRLGSSFFHPVGVSAISRTYPGQGLQKAMGFQSSFGNLGVLVTFSTAVPLYLALGWRSTFVVFAIWTLLDVLLTLVFLTGNRSVIESGARAPSDPNRKESRKRIPLFFVTAAFISGGTYAVVVNFANIYLGSSDGLNVYQTNLIVSGFIVSAFVGALSTGAWSKIVPSNILLAGMYLAASSTIGAFTLFSGNVLLSILTLLVTGFAISATYPLTYTELSRHLASNQKNGASFGVLFSGQTIGASALGLISGYISEYFGLGVSFVMVSGLTLAGSLLTLWWVRRRRSKSL
ncbi:MAG TPA: MFS transporter [Candidatus Dormibacteraeota bacterium]|nr:MFS transporter [Candidatus Dormibacteraeota bacterium]